MGLLLFGSRFAKGSEDRGNVAFSTNHGQESWPVFRPEEVKSGFQEMRAVAF